MEDGSVVEVAPRRTYAHLLCACGFKLIGQNVNEVADGFAEHTKGCPDGGCRFSMHQLEVIDGGKRD